MEQSETILIPHRIGTLVLSLLFLLGACSKISLRKDNIKKASLERIFQKSYSKNHRKLISLQPIGQIPNQGKKDELIKKYLSQQTFQLVYNGFETTCEIIKSIQGDSSKYYGYLSDAIKMNDSYGILKWKIDDCIITTPVIYNDSSILFNVFTYNAFQSSGYLKAINHKRLLKEINKHFLDSMNREYAYSRKFHLPPFSEPKKYSRDEEDHIWIIGGQNTFIMPDVLSFSDPYWGGCSSAELNVNAVEITYFLLRPAHTVSPPYYGDSTATSTMIIGATSSANTTNAIGFHKFIVDTGGLGSLDHIFPPSENGGGSIHAYWGAVGQKCLYDDFSLSSVTISFLDCCGITFNFSDNNAYGFHTAKEDKIYSEVLIQY